MTESSQKRERGSRHKRSAKPRTMRLTSRDVKVIKAVNDFRVMRQDQVERLFFPSRSTAQVRLRLLWEHGFLKRTFPNVIGSVQNSTIYYLVDRRGVELLRNEFGYSDQELRYTGRKEPSDRFLLHTLGLSEIRLAVELSCKANNFPLKTWHDEQVYKADYDKVQVGKRFVAVVPDAYFVVEVPGGVLRFFLEFDRGPEKLSFIKKKMAAYVAYFRSGKCEARYGSNLIRVLTVTEGGITRSGRKRLANIQSITEKLGGLAWFWFARLEEISKKDFFTTPFWTENQTTESQPLINISTMQV